VTDLHLKSAAHKSQPVQIWRQCSLTHAEDSNAFSGLSQHTEKRVASCHDRERKAKTLYDLQVIKSCRCYFAKCKKQQHNSVMKWKLEREFHFNLTAAPGAAQNVNIGRERDASLYTQPANE
jgi:hypothetical protein